MIHLRGQPIRLWPRGRGPGGLLTVLLVEYFDELAFTLVGVAMPFLRDDLDLDYAQVGLLLGIPAVLAAVLEPPLLLLGDTPLRARLILGGGLIMGLSFLLISGADTFAMLLAGLTLSYPASGAFVSLTQASMIERHPARESEMMARWTAAGTLGSLSGPLLFGALIAVGLQWRSTVFLIGAGCLGLALLVRSPRPADPLPLRARAILGDLRANLQATVRLRRLWRWLLLLPLADLMLDVFFGYSALFLVDVVGLPPATAAAAVTLWLLGFLLGQVFVARSVGGSNTRRMIRWTAAATLVVFPLWLIAPVGAPARLAGLALLGLLAAPWYPLLQGEAFAAAPGRAATVTALTSVTGTVGGLLAAFTGLMAAAFGLTAGLAFLVVGPLALVFLTPPTIADKEVAAESADGPR